jgi:ABC-type polysaccharide/polyol phosphate transport system ATPase subunit
MSNIALEMSHVSKKFKRGEILDSLRDLIPAFTGKFLSSTRAVCLKPQELWALNDVSFQVERG